MVGLTHASREGLAENQGSKIGALILAENGSHGHTSDHLITTRETAGNCVEEDMQEVTSALDKMMPEMQ